MSQILFNSQDLSEKDFETIRGVFYRGTGIDLPSHKRVMVASRLAKRLRELKIGGYSAYIKYLGKSNSEINILLNLLTTNVTKFFREPHHFEFLQKEFLPHLVATERPRVVRAWSAGCASGQEPYTLAIVMNEFFERHSGWDFKILASDINTEVLEKAALGIYRWEEVEDIPMGLLKNYFKLGKGPNQGLFKVKDELKRKISFKQINLNEDAADFPINGLLDIIFCRNVFIYFDYEHKAQVVKKFYNRLYTGGCLFIGHSESMNLADKTIGRWEFLKHTVYKKLNS